MDDEEMDDEEEYDFEYSDNLPSSNAEHDDEPSPTGRQEQAELSCLLRALPPRRCSSRAMM